MNAKAISILADPHPCGHIVYPYTDEAHITDAVCLFATAGLRKQEAVVLIMANSHCAPINKRLQAEGFNLEALQGSGQLVCIQAEHLMSRFMVNGRTDERLFKEIVGDIIHRAKASAGNGHPGMVRIFAEMVSLLWIDNMAAAERLEELWNEVIETHSVSLLCTYALTGDAPSAFPESLLATHSHSLAS